MEECPYCATEEAWSNDLSDDYRRHAGGVLCLWQRFRLASRKCGMQNQYCSEYIDGLRSKPALGENLRFKNWPNSGMDYHAILIHRDDVQTFVDRVQNHRRETGQI